MKVAVSIIKEFLQNNNSNSTRNSSSIDQDAFEQHVEQYRRDAGSTKKNPQSDTKTNSKPEQSTLAPTKQKEENPSNSVQIDNDSDSDSTIEIENDNIPTISTNSAPIVLVDMLDTFEIVANIEPLIELDAITEEAPILTNPESNEKQPIIDLDKILVNSQNIIETATSLEDLPELKELSAPEEDESHDVQDTEISEENIEGNIIIPASILPTEVKQLSEVIATPLEVVGKEIHNIAKVETSDSGDIAPPAKFQPSEVVVTAPQAQNETDKSMDNARADVALLQSQQAQGELQKLDTNPASIANAANTMSKNTLEQQSKASKAQGPQPEEFSIIESVTVQPITRTENTSNEMLSDFNQRQENILDTDMLEMQNPKEAFEVIEHGDTSMKITDNKEVTANIPMDQTEDIESVSNQIKTAVQNISNVNGKKITINLTPESLGRVEIEVTVQAGKIISIKIEAAKAETVAILEKNSQILQEALKTVTGGNESSLSFNLKEGNHGGSEQQKSAKNVPIIDLAAHAENADSDNISIARPTAGNIYDVNGSNTIVDMRL